MHLNQQSAPLLPLDPLKNHSTRVTDSNHTTNLVVLAGHITTNQRTDAPTSQVTNPIAPQVLSVITLSSPVPRGSELYIIVCVEKKALFSYFIIVSSTVIKPILIVSAAVADLKAFEKECKKISHTYSISWHLLQYINKMYQ